MTHVCHCPEPLPMHIAFWDIFGRTEPAEAPEAASHAATAAPVPTCLRHSPRRISPSCLPPGQPPTPNKRSKTVRPSVRPGTPRPRLMRLKEESRQRSRVFPDAPAHGGSGLQGNSATAPSSEVADAGRTPCPWGACIAPQRCPGHPSGQPCASTGGMGAAKPPPPGWRDANVRGGSPAISMKPSPKGPQAGTMDAFSRLLTPLAMLIYYSRKLAKRMFRSLASRPRMRRSGSHIRRKL
jgi:hypothetical protein